MRVFRKRFEYFFMIKVFLLGGPLEAQLKQVVVAWFESLSCYVLAIAKTCAVAELANASK